MKNKKQLAVGGGIAAALAVAWAIFNPMPGTTVPVEGSFETQRVTDLTTCIKLTIPYEQVPSAAFYAITFEDSEIGVSTFGETSSGITTADILLSPVENLNVVIYDGERKPIGSGSPTGDGKVIINVTESEVVKVEN